MTRPASHHEQALPEQGCHNCACSRFIEYKRDLLCFKNDRIETIQGEDRLDDVVLVTGSSHASGEHRVIVSLLDGEDYSRVWGGRDVDPSDSCDEWQAVL